MKYRFIVFFYCLVLIGNSALAKDYDTIHAAIQTGNIELAMDTLYQVWNRQDFQQHISAILTTSIKNHQPEIAELLILQTENINTQDKSGTTALHYAVSYDLDKIVRQLANRSDIQINVRNQGGNTALSIAIQRRNTELAKFLIAKGADINLPDAHGHNPLHIAVLNGNQILAKYLVELGAKINVINVYNETPLIIAIRDNYPLIAEILLQKKPEVSVQDRLGNTALHYAALNNNVAQIQQLVTQDDEVIHIRNLNQMTPLATATLFGRYAAAEKLTQMGAHTDIVVDNQHNLLHLAAMSGDIRFIELYKDVELNHQDDNGNTPIQHAAYYQQTKFAIALLNKNPRLGVLNKNSETILHLASRTNDADLIHALFAHWPEINIEQSNAIQNTPLHIASKFGRTEVVKALIVHQANIDVTTEQQVTPLHYATLNGHEETSLVLLEHGARSDILTLHQDSVLHFAARTGLSKVCEVLIQRGHPIDMENYSEEYPLYLAINKGHLQAAFVLFQQGAVLQSSHLEKDVFHLEKFAIKAAKNNQLDLLAYLLPHIGNIDRQDTKGNTLLHYAVLSKNFQMVSAILKEGANSNISNIGGNSPLHLATRRPYFNISNSLVNARADGLRVNKLGNTPLHRLLQRQDLLKTDKWRKMVLHLLNNIDSSNINRVDKQGNTLLHLAILAQQTEIVKKLLQLGIDTKIRNYANKTAFDIAKEKRYKKLLALQQL